MTINDLSPTERFFILPDGRYPCDSCDAATDIEALVCAGGGKVCQDCAEYLDEVGK